MFNWFKKKSTKPAPLEMSVKDYPIAEYKVYWEKIITEVEGGFKVDVRFYNYASSPQVEHQQVTVFGKTKEEVYSRADAEIASYLKQFKR